MTDTQTPPVVRAAWHERFSLPVLMKEMRGRMRGGRTPWVVFLAAAPIIAAALLVLIAASREMSNGYTASSLSAQSQHLAQTGKLLFAWLISIEGILIFLLAPALTSGSISLEREQRTLEFLLLTRMSHWRIVLGKYVSALSFLLLMVATALPVAAVGFILGGVDPGLFLSFLGIAVTTAMGFGAIGLWCSSAAPRTYTAVAGAYGLTIAWQAFVPLCCVGMLAALPGFGAGYETFLDYMPVLGILMVVAVLPAAVLALLVSSLLRRPQPWYVNLGLWLACVCVLCALVLGDPSTPGALRTWIYHGPEALLSTGNPAVAFGILASTAGGDGPDRMPLGHWYIPVCMGINLLVTLAFLQATALRLRRAAPETGVGRGD